MDGYRKHGRARKGGRGLRPQTVRDEITRGIGPKRTEVSDAQKKRRDP